MTRRFRTKSPDKRHTIGRQRDNPLEHGIAPRCVVGEGHLNRLIRSQRFNFHREDPIQPIASVLIAAAVCIVMHSGCVAQAKVFMGKTSCIALTIKGKPIADGFA